VETKENLWVGNTNCGEIKKIGWVETKIVGNYL
jgi:hypothetical protein